MDLVRMIQGLGAVSEASGLRRSARQKHGVYALCTHIHVYTVVSRVSTPCSAILLLLPNISPLSPDCSFHRSRCLIGLQLDILFSSNRNIHKSLCCLCFWASDPLIDRFYLNLSIKGSEAQKQRPHKLLRML